MVTSASRMCFVYINENVFGNKMFLLKQVRVHLSATSRYLDAEWAQVQRDMISFIFS